MIRSRSACGKRAWRWCLHVRHDPFRPQTIGQPAAGPHELRRERARADAHQEAFRHRPRLLDGVIAHVGLHLRVHPLGGPPERQLAQRDQIALAEEVVDRFLGLLRDVDLAFFEALEEIIRRQVDQLDLVGALEHRIGHRLADDHAGDLRDEIVQALDVLDVQRRVDRDAGVQQLEDVLPPLGVARARGIGVRQLIDQDHGGAAGQRRIEVELLRAWSRHRA